MYSSEKNPGINWKSIILKGIFCVLFILLIIWLFPKTPNMKPFYSNVFRENISYMQDAAKSYYTTDRLPKVVGEKSEMTLQDMIDKNLIVPFVDKDGKSCDTNLSYVQVTKEEDEYVLKVNLVCNDEKSYILETFGCYDYCEDDSCKTENTVAQKTEYQFKQAYTAKKTNYSCPSGYTLNGTTCTKGETKIINATAKYGYTSTKVDPIKTAITKNVSYDCSYDTVEKVCTDKTKTEYVTETYTCNKTEEKETCTTKNVTKSYNCECATKFINGLYTYSCNTCYETIPVKTCATETITIPNTCTRQVPKTVTYQDCKDVTKKVEKTCTRTEITGYKTECPSGTIESLVGGTRTCNKLSSVFIGYTCPSNEYTLDNKKCIYSTTDKIAATANTKTVTEYRYKWSANTTLEGWERTGKTRSVQASA